MSLNYITDQVFQKLSSLPEGEYEQCQFLHCDLSDFNLSEYKFMDCEFVNCNLSLAKLHHTSFQEVKFKGCKLLGLHFDNCNSFGLSLDFENCLLNQSVFYQLKLIGITFSNCQMHEVDFTETDLCKAVFDACDLTGAIFDRTRMEKTDFGKAFNFSISPLRNNLKKTKFSAAGLSGLLNDWDLIIE
jgi:fluoroquinolone resistance protein